ncbi:MAG TPA: RNA polymerase sigma factor [Acidobacteriota bacterium]|nr:RNA polymerase sigma factor [Acidobacteriota bacterium]
MEVRNGDVAKLGVLFERYQRMLYNFYLRMSGDRSLSEDLVQDVFFRMLKYRHTYRENSDFVTWMFQIARNARFDHFRKVKREVALDDEINESISPDVPPDDVMGQKQEAALLQKSLVQLTHDKREALVLSRFQNFKYEQIAELVGCDVSTVKTRVFRAMQDLRENFFRLSGKNHELSNGKRTTPRLFNRQS